MKAQLPENRLYFRTGISIPGRWGGNIFSIRVLIFGAITLTAIILRLYLSFSHDLILGIDGGYYPVQVRSILKTGLLSFNDVPLYFYFCASIVKIISLLGFAITNDVIISVIKIVDSIALPLLAIPLYKIMIKNDQKLPFYSAAAILFFAIFSFSPFIMLGDLEKNAFALPLLVVYVYFLEDYLASPNQRNLIMTLISLFIIAFTHFGVFAFGLAFLTIPLLVTFGRKAILPSLITIALGGVIIALFDFNRAFRLITFWNEIFARQNGFQGPMFLPLLLNTFISYALALFGIHQYRKHKHKTDKITGNIILSLVVIIFIFAFPFYESQYVQRFHVLLFVPQSLLILYLIRMNQCVALPFTISLALLTTAFIFIYLKEGKKPCIDELAYLDLRNLKSHIPATRENTIVIARHGIEFWTAWNLNVKVGNDRSMDKLELDKYKNIIFLQYKNEERHGPPGNGSLRTPQFFTGKDSTDRPPRGAQVPQDFKLIYSSPYFNAYQNLN